MNKFTKNYNLICFLFVLLLFLILIIILQIGKPKPGSELSICYWLYGCQYWITRFARRKTTLGIRTPVADH